MKNDLSDMPLIQALIDYNRKKPKRFHMPGHKGEALGDPAGILEKNLYRFDVTEIPGLDNLNSPSGVIGEAQRKLAVLYGADFSFFLVNGATSGITAMMGAALKPGEKAIVSRACHRSVMNGIIYTGANPVYVMPEAAGALGVPGQINSESFMDILENNIEARAAVLPGITYQGFCPDLGKISEYAGSRGVPVLVDEAHGPHLAFSDKLPKSAGDYPVQGWVQSPHKILTSLTQSAWLHIKGSKEYQGKVAANLASMTSSSPSYILMGSLDMARCLMEKRGTELAEKLLEIAESARHKINAHTPFYCVGREIAGSYGIYDIDLSRLMINVSDAGFTGFEIEAELREKQIYAEYADYCNICLLLGFSTEAKDINTLVKVLSGFAGKKPLKTPPMVFMRLPATAMNPREAFFTEGEKILLKFSKGRIAQEPIVPYPPGIPLVMPGEIIEQDHIEAIDTLISFGGSCQGLGQDCSITAVKK